MSGKRKALISVSDKTGVAEFARGLVDLGFEILSTGGTLGALEEAGVTARQVSDYTGVPEILGGRVKTLHPAIFGGILARRDDSSDLETLEEHGMAEIDVVAVNLYPFEATVAQPNVKDADAIEKIDIGGPSLLRAAAKNHAHLYAVVDPADYPRVVQAISDGRDADGRQFRRKLASKVFAHCSGYDRAITNYMDQSSEEGEGLPAKLGLDWPRAQTLRYGENPHQIAAFYRDPGADTPNLAQCKQLHGKELSYNNYLDGDAALEMIREFDETAAVVLKHSNPCGVGRNDSLVEAYRQALACDPLSAFGGIVGLNREVDKATAEAMAEIFLEVIIAPSFSDEAVEVLGKKKNIRLLESGDLHARKPTKTYRTVSGGLLCQTSDVHTTPRDEMTVVTENAPTEEDWDGLLFAWKVVRWVKSNAIVYATRDRTLGIGAGQMSRVDAARFGLLKAEAVEESKALLKGSYLSSDAFFPFRDVVDLAAEAGVKGLIQPGGSVRDQESIDAANEHGMFMVFTGQRHFRH